MRNQGQQVTQTSQTTPVACIRIKKKYLLHSKRLEFFAELHSKS